MSRSAEHDARNTAFLNAFKSLEAVKAQSIPNAVVIPKTGGKLGLEHQIDDVPNSDGAKIHWLGDRSAKKVILYFHGGGYGLSAFDGHVIFLNQCTAKLAAKGHKTVVAFLEYGLTKAKKFPTQNIQAVESLRYVISKGYKPSDIIIGGDSAGGNMSLGLISHLLHPLKGLTPLKLEEPLAGQLLISPWVSFRSDSPSFARNVSKDIHGAKSMLELASDFVDESERNEWTEPIRADASWWKSSSFPARKTLNVWGDYELFHDDISKFGKTLVEAGVDVKNVECPMQVHIDCILDAQSGLEVGPMSTETWKWLETVLSKT